MRSGLEVGTGPSVPITCTLIGRAYCHVKLLPTSIQTGVDEAASTWFGLVVRPRMLR